ncbi:MAG: PDZ domain-containing protein [Lachnospiraceae bacterium]|nr:PDZ domain-containing protein [Lachnospiraceae bacterium]
MAENDQLMQDSDFLREKIKERPINKKRLLRRTLITAGLGVVFALIASVTFLIMEPLISKRLAPEETPKQVDFPEEIDINDEIAPEDMLVDEQPEEVTPEVQEIPEEKIEEIVATIPKTLDDYNQLGDASVEYVREQQKAMVTVTGAVSNTDWFNETYESKGATAGFIFFNNDVDLLILVDRTNIAKAEKITVTFFDGTNVEGYEKMHDGETNLAVVGVPLSSIPEYLTENIKIASLGSSNPVSGLAGLQVVAIGSPVGHDKSVCFGRITSDSSVLNKADSNYKLITTDIYGSANGSGVLMDMKGQVIGIIAMKENTSDMGNALCAIGISELKKIITKMGNGIEIPYAGIVGTDVTMEIHNTQDIPYGAFIKEIYMDSPAMLAGIQRGDVIVSVNDKNVDRFATYTNAIMSAHPGEAVSITVKRPAQDEYKEMTFKVEVTTN